MFWQQKWRALCARIDGLRQAGEYLSNTLPRAPGDSFGIVRKWVAKELPSIVDELERFKRSTGAELPAEAIQELDRILKRDWFTDRPEQINENLVSIGALITFRTAFDYMIQDSEIEARNRTELAFEHIRRILLVDKDVRQRWSERYRESGETGCEKLGALHLLSHGILAFKISGQRGITDLAFNEPLEVDDPVIRRAARALVLTEWKAVKTPDEMPEKIDEAQEQLKQYEGGVLGATELTHTRYVVLVSDAHLTPPANMKLGEITYRHIFLPVSEQPLTPSQAAKKRAAPGGTTRR